MLGGWQVWPENYMDPGFESICMMGVIIDPHP